MGLWFKISCSGIEGIKTEREKAIKGLARFTITHCLFQILSLITHLAVCYQSSNGKKSIPGTDVSLYWQAVVCSCKTSFMSALTAVHVELCDDNCEGIKILPAANFISLIT